jgi:hypothetical protein
VQDGIVGAGVAGARVVGARVVRAGVVRAGVFRAGVVEPGVDEVRFDRAGVVEVRFDRAGVVDAGVNETTGRIDEVRFDSAGADEAGVFSAVGVVGLAVLFHWHALATRFTLHSGRAANSLWSAWMDESTFPMKLSKSAVFLISRSRNSNKGAVRSRLNILST